MSKVTEYQVGTIRTDRGEFLDKGNWGVDPAHEDFAGRKEVKDGIADAREAFAAADAWAQQYGLNLALSSGTYAIASNLTLTSGLKVPRGAVLKPASGVTVTINGPLEAGLHQAFDTSAGGSVAFGLGQDRLRAEWWGFGPGVDAPTNTAALQAAATAQNNARFAVTPPGGSAVGNGPALVLPDGRCLLDDEISVGPYSEILSEGRTILWQTNTAKRILVYPDAYTIAVRGIKFVNGTRQAEIRNANVDSSTFDFRECEFQLSTDFAVWTLGTSGIASPTTSTTLAAQAVAGDNTISVASATGWAVGDDIVVQNDEGEYHACIVSSVSGTTLGLQIVIPSHWTAAAAASIGNVVLKGDFHMSARLTLRDCKWMRPKKALFNVCDEAIADGWISVSKNNFDTDSAAFVNLDGTMRLSIFGVPTMTEGGTRLTSPRWVDLYDGDLYAQGTRFGGEEGGMAVVWSFGPPQTSTPWQGSVISIKDGWISAGPSSAADSGVVQLRTQVPQTINITGNTRLTDVGYIVNSGGVDLDAYFDSFASPDRRFKFTVYPNQDGGVPAVPAQLLPYLNGSDTNRNIASVPASGWWALGQRVENESPTFGRPAAFWNMVAGEPGIWGYERGISPFPTGAQQAVDTATAGEGKVTFDLPTEVKTFMALVTLSSQPHVGSGSYRGTATYLLAFTVGHNGAAVTDYLITSALFNPDNPGVTPEPTLTSAHWGSGDTGSANRPQASGGQFSIVMNNDVGFGYISVEPIHVGF